MKGREDYLLEKPIDAIDSLLRMKTAFEQCRKAPKQRGTSLHEDISVFVDIF